MIMVVEGLGKIIEWLMISFEVVCVICDIFYFNGVICKGMVGG